MMEHTAEEFELLMMLKVSTDLKIAESFYGICDIYGNS